MYPKPRKRTDSHTTTLQLGAQARHIHLDGVVAEDFVPVLDGVLQLLLAHHQTDATQAAGPARPIRGRSSPGFVRLSRRACRQYPHTACRPALRVSSPASTRRSSALHAGFEFGQRKRLDHVVVSTQDPGRAHVHPRHRVRSGSAPRPGANAPVCDSTSKPLMSGKPRSSTIREKERALQTTNASVPVATCSTS